MRKTHIGELVFFWILFGIVGLLSYAVMSPYLTALFLALVFGVLFSPVFRRIKRLCGANENLAALLTVSIVLFAILVPLIFIGIVLFKEVVDILNGFSSQSPFILLVDSWVRTIETHIRSFSPGFQLQFEMETSLRAVLSWVSGNLDRFFSGIVTFLFDIFLITIALFFFFRDGEKLRKFAIRWSPLSDSYDEGIITKLDRAITSVVRGTLVTAVAQGLLVGLGFALFGIQNPVLWGFVATIAALLPMVGTGVITFPAAFYLMATGAIPAGVGLLIWGVLIVGLIDNILRPFLMNRDTHIHSFLILLSVFGGLSYFGPIGFLAGPIVLAFFFVLLDIYPEIVEGKALE
jgi:predicted PurR-regulated permease PerM